MQINVCVQAFTFTDPHLLLVIVCIFCSGIIYWLEQASYKVKASYKVNILTINE